MGSALGLGFFAGGPCAEGCVEGLGFAGGAPAGSLGDAGISAISSSEALEGEGEGGAGCSPWARE